MATMTPDRQHQALEVNAFVTGLLFGTAQSGFSGLIKIDRVVPFVNQSGGVDCFEIVTESGLRIRVTIEPVLEELT